MTGKCPECGVEYSVPSRRGTKVGNYKCPNCHVPLQGATAGVSRGRYQCPIAGYTITLGLTGVQLAEPMILEFQPGTALQHTPHAYHRTEPDSDERRRLDRVAGRVLGPGAVVSIDYDPHRHDDKDDAFRTEQLKAAGLYLVPADNPGDPADWIVNGKLTYRACTACGNQTPDVPDARVPQEWRPRRTQIWRGSNRHTRRAEPINQGPHPTSSLACSDCDPRPRT
jgi:hypothetical protein